MVEGKTKVHHYWEEGIHGSQRHWDFSNISDERISKEYLRAFKNELQEQCILHKDEEDTLWWGYTQKGSFSIKEGYNIRIRRQELEDEIWTKKCLTNPWPKVATFF